MAKPKRIILIRHAQSQGNVDLGVYAHTPDHMVALTPKGHKQAQAAGRKLRRLIGNHPLQVYVSTHLRAAQTLEEVLRQLSGNTYRLYEEPRLREQEWGMFDPPETRKMLKEAYLAYGPFFFRFPQGESGGDVYDRISSFLDTLWREFQKTDSPENYVIVSHGLTIRLLLMRWFHLKASAFDSMPNPRNGQIITLRLGKNGKYSLSDADMKAMRITQADVRNTSWQKLP